MLKNVLTVAPSIEPVTAAELDDYLRGDGELASSESDLLEALITAAREYVETQTKLRMITQTWTLWMDHFPPAKEGLGWWDGVRLGAVSMGASRSFNLPVGPFVSGNSLVIKTYDTDNTATVFSDTNYRINHADKLASVVLNDGIIWPTFTRSTDGIEVIYQVGYGALATAVPSGLRTAIKMLAGHWYENREFTKTQSDQAQAYAPMHVASVINSYKVRTL